VERGNRRSPLLQVAAPIGRYGKETEMFKLTIRYTRYALAALGSVGFGIALN